MIEKEFTVIAIHGEGDRNTVNAMQSHRNRVDIAHYSQHSISIPPNLLETPDLPPDITIILRDAETQHFRIEWTPKTWEEVEEWKGLVGYDQDKRHWKHGAKVMVKIG